MRNSFVHAAKRWIDLCEESFLGRGRKNAKAAVEEAIRLQSTWRAPNFETDELFCLGLYRPPLSEIVLSVKMQRWSRAGTELGKALGKRVKSQWRSDVICPQSGWIVVPIPTPFLRRLTRGIDHSDIIAAAVADELQWPLRRVLWQRHGSTQKTLDRSGRLQRLQRFAVRRRNGTKLAGQSVLLVDDIRTTGATLAEASRILRRHGAGKVACAVICLVENEFEPSN